MLGGDAFIASKTPGVVKETQLAPRSGRLGGMVQFLDCRNDAPTFLVVEDDFGVAASLIRTLKTFGVAQAAHTLREALSLLEHGATWHAVFVDISLPDGSGFEFLEALRAKSMNVPALILTGHCDRSHANRALDLDAQYAVKPADADRVTAFVLRAIRRRETGAVRLNAVIELWRSQYALTATEIVIFARVASGATRAEIEIERGITPSTLKKHLENLRQKTGDSSVSAAAHRLLRDAAMLG